MSNQTITTVKGNTYEVYTRETELERIVMATDKDGIEHVKHSPRSFSFNEITQDLLEEIEA